MSGSGNLAASQRLNRQEGLGALFQRIGFRCGRIGQLRPHLRPRHVAQRTAGLIPAISSAMNVPFGESRCAAAPQSPGRTVEHRSVGPDFAAGASGGFVRNPVICPFGDECLLPSSVAPTLSSL